MGSIARIALSVMLLFCVCLAPSAVRAQQPPSELEVRVTDTSERPLANARVYVNGPLTSAVLTPNDGIVRFTDVDPGIYTLRVVLSSYATVDIGEVEVLAGRRKIVAVVLSRNAVSPRPGATPAPSPPPGELTEIGRVRARPAYTITSVDVDEGSPIRRISENLADALNKIGGITVDQDQQSGTLTISLRNASNTVSTVGGAPILGGGASSLQTVASDLATGVGADTGGGFGATAGGSVNFRTLEPTRTLQSQLTASYGTYEHTTTQLSLSGSAHKLGFAFQHGVTGGNSILTGLDFEDTSGETYVHDGAYTRDGNLLKLRYPVGHVMLNAFYLAGTSRSSPLCDQWVTILPCGYGPGGSLHSASHQVNLSAQGQIGNVILSSGLFANAYSTLDDELSRVISGVPSPYRADTAGRGTGAYTYATLGIHRHTVLVNLWTFSGQGRTLASGAFQGTSTATSRSAGAVIGDTLKFSDRWSTTLAYGLNQNLAETRSAADISVTWTPSRSETISFSSGQYANGANFFSTGFFGDPSGAQYNCDSGQVRVQGPADPPVAGTSDYSQISYSRRGKRGSIRLSAYDNVDRGGGQSTFFPLVALPASEIPAGYLAQIAAFYHGATVCGAQAFDPSNVFIYEQLAGTTVRNRGVDASGQIVLGRAAIVLPSYSISSSALISSDPRLLFAGSPYAPGGQIPFRPLHKASLLFDAAQPRAHLEYVINGTWLSAPNANALGPYITVAAGVTWKAPRGNFSAFVNNLFNADTGLFATSEFAQTIPLRGGGTYLPVPNLLAPRSYTLLYSVRAGRLK